MESKTLKGTTTIGLTCSDGVVFVADSRASWGSFVASKKARKIFKLNDCVAASVAGSVGDAEQLMRVIQAEANLYAMEHAEEMSANAMATLLANILQGNKYFPYLVQLLIGGFDGDKARIYTLDPVGGLIEEDMASSGSGSPMAYGVLEQLYSEEKTVKDNILVALKALRSAMERDSATGNQVSLVTVTRDGFKEYSKEEVDGLYAQIIK
ncbi:MAG: archaeal proteasome endopeptidase complex subunit beta [Candidatus Altiarchaeota archaeon]